MKRGSNAFELVPPTLVAMVVTEDQAISVIPSSRIIHSSQLMANLNIIHNSRADTTSSSMVLLVMPHRRRHNAAAVDWVVSAYLCSEVLLADCF